MIHSLPDKTGAAKEREQALRIEARLDEAYARERVWASGICPDSGMPIHSCHRTVCDCFGAEDCTTCGGGR